MTGNICRFEKSNGSKEKKTSEKIAAVLQHEGGVETRYVYVQYVQGIQPKVPARITFIEKPRYVVGTFCSKNDKF